MSTTPIADPSDLAVVLGVASVDEDRAAVLIELAQGLAETVISPLPYAARGVVLGIAARVYSNPQNVQSQTVGPYTAQFGTGASGGLYLSRQDRATLNRIAGRGGAFTFDVGPTASPVLPPWDSVGSYVQGFGTVEGFIP